MNSLALPGTTESIAFLMMGKFILGGYNGKYNNDVIPFGNS